MLNGGVFRTLVELISYIFHAPTRLTVPVEVSTESSLWGPVTIAVAAIVAAAIAAWFAWQRMTSELKHDREMRADELKHDREMRDRDELRKLLDEGAISLSKASQNLINVMAEINVASVDFPSDPNEVEELFLKLRKGIDVCDRTLDADWHIRNRMGVRLHVKDPLYEAYCKADRAMVDWLSHMRESIPPLSEDDMGDLEDVHHRAATAHGEFDQACRDWAQVDLE